MIVISKINLVGIYVVKANNRNTRTRWEICSRSTTKTAEWTSPLFPATLVILINIVKIFTEELYICKLRETLKTLERKFYYMKKCFLFVTPSIQSPSHYLVILSLHQVLKGLSTGAKYEVVSISYCWIMLLTLRKTGSIKQLSCSSNSSFLAHFTP